MAERGKCIDGKPHWDVRRGLRLRCKVCGKFKPKAEPVCSSVTYNSSLLSQKTIEVYDAAAPALAAKFDQIGSRRADVERAFALLSVPQPRVIELGCGNGRDAEEMLKFTSDYTGVDASSGMISLAQARLPQAKFRVGRMEDFQFPAGLDVVFAFASLLHLDRNAVESVLSRARAALHPGGLVYISVKRGPYRMKMKRDEFGVRAFYFYDEPTLAKMARKTGYVLVYQDAQTIGKTDWLTVALRPA